MTTIANRVASRYLQAQEQQQGQQQQAMPKSNVGRKMVTEAIEAIEKALKDGDDELFHEQLEKLNKAAGEMSKE